MSEENRYERRLRIKNEFRSKVNEQAIPPPEESPQYKAFQRGLRENEPIVVGLLGAVRYAIAYRNTFEGTLAEDGVLGPGFLHWVEGLRMLLDGYGCVAMELGVTTDSKDNRYCERLYRLALEEGGFQ